MLMSGMETGEALQTIIDRDRRPLDLSMPPPLSPKEPLASSYPCGCLGIDSRIMALLLLFLSLSLSLSLSLMFSLYFSSVAL